MLTTGLYKLIESSIDGEKFIYKIELDSTHQIYEGHFPDMPVLPGVCTLHIIKSCLSGSLGQNIRFTNIKECKFLAPIIPTKNNKIEIKAEIKEDSINCIVSDSDNTLLKLKGNIERS